MIGWEPDSMPCDWEVDTRYNLRRQRDEGLTPYVEMRRWRQRFWYAVFLDAVLSVLVLLLALAIR